MGSLTLSGGRNFFLRGQGGAKIYCTPAEGGRNFFACAKGRARINLRPPITDRRPPVPVKNDTFLTAAVKNSHVLQSGVFLDPSATYDLVTGSRILSFSRLQFKKNDQYTSPQSQKTPESRRMVNHLAISRPWLMCHTIVTLALQCSVLVQEKAFLFIRHDMNSK